MKPTTLLAKTLVCLLLCSFVFSACGLLEEPVTEKEAIAFGKEIEKSFVEKKPALFNNIIDMRAFTEKIKALSNGKISRSQLATLPETWEKRKLGTEIIKANGDEGTYELVKHYEKDKKQHLLFRMYGPGGLNYHDIELVRSGDKVKAADIYVYMSGETFSKTFSDVVVDMNAYYDKKPGEEKKSIDAIKEMKKLMTAEKYIEAKELYDGLNAHFKKQKSFQLMYVMIASELDQDLYKQAMETYTATFPNEPNMHLMMIDHHILQKNYTGALNDINKLDSFVNKDPFLDFFRGNIYNAMDDTTQAITHFEQLHTTMPRFTDGIIELTALYLDTKQKQKAEDLMKEYQANNLDKDKLETIRILYPDFKF